MKKSPASVGKTAALLEQARATNRKRKSNFSPRKQPKRNVKSVKPFVPGQGGGMKKSQKNDVESSSDSDSGAD